MHTPKPWRWSRSRGRFERLLGPNDKAILFCNTQGEVVVENKDDAQLIAVAPLLLEACELFKGRLEEQEDPKFDEELNYLASVIASAKARSGR